MQMNMFPDSTEEQASAQSNRLTCFWKMQMTMPPKKKKKPIVPPEKGGQCKKTVPPDKEDDRASGQRR